MDKWIAILAIREPDIDDLVASAGGRRLRTSTGPDEPANADYVLNEAVVELKLVVEEGLDKERRRAKVATLFGSTQRDRPVVVLDPALLAETDRRAYCNALLGPIQTAVKKAASQLEASANGLGGTPSRVLFIVNCGYTAVDHHEFTQLVLKSVRNDTSKIDNVAIAGMYHYGDGFDAYVPCPCELHSIGTGRPFPSFDALKHGWDATCGQLMTSVVTGTSKTEPDKLPVVDLSYEYDGTAYVKPAPPIGIPSQFWTAGRPRSNSTGMTRCPAVGTPFPKLDCGTWARFARCVPRSGLLQASYAKWQAFSAAEALRLASSLQPFVPIAVDFDECAAWCVDHQVALDGPCIWAFALARFDRLVREIISGAIDLRALGSIPAEYVLLHTDEIGQDLAFDLSSIYLVRETPSGAEREEILHTNRMFFEHALALSAAYALKNNVTSVTYERDSTYAWS